MTDEPITPSEEQIPAGAAEQMPSGEEERPAAGEQAMPEMRAEDALLFSISMFADLSWIYLGIRAHPASGEAKADLAQARLAIDAVKALVTLAEGRLEAHQMRDLQNLLSSLQLNYVQRA